MLKISLLAYLMRALSNSASISATVGRLPFKFLSRDSTSLVFHWATPMGFSNRATHTRPSHGHVPCTAADRWTTCHQHSATGHPPLKGKNSSCPRIPARRLSFSDQL